MKRFTKMLALGMAVALTFGMTVSASGNDVPNPSRTTTPAIGGGEGVVASGYTEDEWKEKYNDTVEAVKSGKALKGLGTKLTYTIEDVFDLDVDEGGGKVTYAPVTTPFGKGNAEYGTTWGYILLHFLEDGTLKEEIKMSLVNGVYTANVTTGSPYALVAWKLYELGDWESDYETDEDGNRVLKQTDSSKFVDGTTAEKGQASIPVTDYAAKATQALYGGLGNTVARTHNSLYTFTGFKGTVMLDLSEDSYVEFPVADIDGDHKYIVMLNPVKADGSVDFSIDVPTSKVLERIGKDMYQATLPKGRWLATVYEVAIDPSLVQAPVDPVPAPEAAAAGAATGTQTGGVVSPKTGEMLPVAVILAAVCLAGAAVCAKKARTNA